MKNRRLVLMFCVLTGICLTIPQAVSAQKSFNGNWAWRSPMNKKKEQTGVWVDIKQKGNKATGSIWFNALVNGEADGSDGSFVPFIGTISGDTMTIEFDSSDVHGIEEENIRYKKPRRKPDTAVLQLKNGRLEWRQTYGTFNVGLAIPKQMTFRREKQN